MEETVQSREAIALRSLSGIIASMSDSTGNLGAMWHLQDAANPQANQEKMCAVAFQMADAFIKERSKQV